jgi:hypothetical protein
MNTLREKTNAALEACKEIYGQIEAFSMHRVRGCHFSLTFDDFPVEQPFVLDLSDT